MESWRVPQSCFILLLLACSRPDAQLDRSSYEEGGEGFGPLRPGIEVLLEDSLHLVEGRRGLLNPFLRLLAPRLQPFEPFRLVQLFQEPFET